MKKIAVAVAAALLAGSAAAADVTLYGVVDTGFAYTSDRNKDTIGGDNETTSTKSFAMKSGNTAGSRWGLKGNEDLGNGVKVGFKLESGFSSDTGKGSDDGLFNRESTISLSGSFGTIYAGRMGSLIRDLGSAGWYGSMASPFGSGWQDIAGHEAVMSMQHRKNNTLIYMSPRFSGLQFSAQYSMGDDEGKENKPSTNRYAALGLDYQVGALEVGFLVDYTNKNSSAFTSDEYKAATVSDLIDKNAWTVNLAANYDCGFAKSFIAAQYFKNVNPFDFGGIDDAFTQDDVDDDVDADEDRMLSLKGYGVNLGVDVPAFGGNAMLSIGYADADVRFAKEKAGTMKGYTALAGYNYPISKRTSVYVGAGYTRYKLTSKVESGSYKASKFQAMTGLKHTF